MGFEILKPNATFGGKVKSFFTGKDYYKTETGVKISTEKYHGSVYVDENGEVYADGLKNAKIKGTKNNDSITIENSTISKIKAKRGDDNITAINSDLNKIYGNLGRDLINIHNSKVRNIKAGWGNDSVFAQSSEIRTIKGNLGKDSIYTHGGTTRKVDDGSFFRREDISINNDPINNEVLKKTEL